MKKVLFIIIGLLLSSSLFAKVEVQLWEKWPAHLDVAYDEVIAKFEQNNPDIKIKRTHFEDEDLRYNFQTAAFSGNPPGLVVSSSDTIGLYALMGIIKPVKKVKGFDRSVVQRLFPQSVEQLLVDKQLFGIPEQIGGHITLIYNKKYVRKVPTTWQEIMDSDYKTQYKVVFNVNDPKWLAGFLGAYNGWFFNKRNAPTLNTPQMKKALEFIQDLAYKYKVVPQGCDYNQADALFKEGRAAFILNGDWSYSDYEKVLGRDLGIARVPMVNDGDYYTPLTDVQGMFFPEKSPKDVEDAACKFVEFITRKDVQMQLTLKNKSLPVNMEAAEDPEIKKDSILGGSIDQMLMGKPIPNLPEMRAVWDAIRPSQEDVMNNRTTPEKAAKDMQKLAKEKISEMYE